MTAALIIFSQTKFSIGYKNFVIIPDSSGFNFQVRIARQRVNIFSHAIINLTGCVTESVLISFDIFPNVYPVIYDILEIIRKSFLGCHALTVFPTILDLAEACELKIKYA